MTLRQELQLEFSKEFEKALVKDPILENEKGITLKLDKKEKIYIGYDKAPRKFAVKLARKVHIFDFLLHRIFWGKREWIAAVQSRKVPIFSQRCTNCQSPNIVGIWLHEKQIKCRKCEKEFTVIINSTLEPINDILRRLDLG